MTVDSESTEASRLPPHPPLSDYYASDCDRQTFLNQMFDRTASYYRRIDNAAAFGSGAWYRRSALLHAGLKTEQRVLDVACGPGLVTLCAQEIVGPKGLVIGLDPSRGMLAEARHSQCRELVQGLGDQLPFRDASFDFLSMGYALRHVADLAQAFAEFARVLRQGGIVLILELSQPRSRLLQSFAKFYIRELLSRLFSSVYGDRTLQTALQYWWDSTEQCIAPEAIVQQLRHAGFTSCTTKERIGGLLREYRAVRT